MARIKALLGPLDAATLAFVEQHIAEPWFPPAFWAAMAGAAVLALQLFLGGRVHLGKVILFAVLGCLFGLWLQRSTFSLSQRATRLEAKGDAGDPVACRKLALLYQQGAPGLARDLQTARKWFQAGAEGGDRPAMLQLAEQLYWGIGGLQDKDAAAAWRRKARKY